MADIQISTQTLTDTATKVRSINDQLDEKLAEISREMNNLDAEWDSKGADEIVATMNARKPKFEQYKQIVETYAKFLDDTAASYESTESAIYGDASVFR